MGWCPRSGRRSDMGISGRDGGPNGAGRSGVVPVGVAGARSKWTVIDEARAGISNRMVSLPAGGETGSCAVDRGSGATISTMGVTASEVLGSLIFFADSGLTNVLLGVTLTFTWPERSVRGPRRWYRSALPAIGSSRGPGGWGHRFSHCKFQRPWSPRWRRRSLAPEAFSEPWCESLAKAYGACSRTSPSRRRRSASRMSSFRSRSSNW